MARAQFSNETIDVDDLEDGQLAEIITPEDYEGQVVQRVGEDLIWIGEGAEGVYPGFYEEADCDSYTCRPLKKGDKVTL